MKYAQKPVVNNMYKETCMKRFKRLHIHRNSIHITRGPWALTLSLRTNLAMGQSSKSCAYTLFLSQDVEIEHIFTLWAAVSEIMADFQNCNIWP